MQICILLRNLDTNRIGTSPPGGDSKDKEHTVGFRGTQGPSTLQLRFLFKLGNVYLFIHYIIYIL